MPLLQSVWLQFGLLNIKKGIINQTHFNIFLCVFKDFLLANKVKLVCSDPYEFIEIYVLKRGEDPLKNFSQYFSDYVHTQKIEAESV